MEIGYEKDLDMDTNEQGSYEELFRKEEELKQRNLKAFKPVTYECIIPREVAENQQKLEDVCETKFCLEKAQDISNNLKDADREKKAELNLRLEEEKLEKLLKKFKNLEEKLAVDANSLKPKEAEFLKKTSEPALKKYLLETRSQRQQVSKNRVSLNSIRRGMEQDLKLLRRTSTGNSWRTNESGRVVAYYKSAPKYVIQDLKRSKEAIGRDVAQMFTKSENLKKLNLTDVVKLLKEYKEVWDTEDSMWNTITKVMENIENNKADISRMGLVQACWALLSLEVQTKAENAMQTLFGNTSATYEFKLPALVGQRVEKIKIDGRGESFLKKKAQIRDHAVNSKYKTIFNDTRTGTKKGGYKGNRVSKSSDKVDSNKKSKPNNTTPKSGGYKGKNFIKDYDHRVHGKGKPSRDKKGSDKRKDFKKE